MYAAKCESAAGLQQVHTEVDNAQWATEAYGLGPMGQANERIPQQAHCWAQRKGPGPLGLAHCALTNGRPPARLFGELCP